MPAHIPQCIDFSFLEHGLKMHPVPQNGLRGDMVLNNTLTDELDVMLHHM